MDYCLCMINNNSKKIIYNENTILWQNKYNIYIKK